MPGAGSSPPSPPGPPRLLDRVREAARLRHLSPRTEKAYVAWIRRFILFHAKRHPREMGAPEVVAFLTHLAAERRVDATTQNQALSALLFLYRVVLGRELEGLDAAARARASRPLPVVLSRDEVRAVLAKLPDPHRLVATLLYGGGLRLLEALRLRVKDLDLERRQLIVRGGKGDRDRRAPLPLRLRDPLRHHLERVHALHDRDRRAGVGPWLPGALGQKHPGAHLEWGWYWVFPALRTGTDPRTGAAFRHHLHETAVQRIVKRAAARAGIPKRVKPRFAPARRSSPRSHPHTPPRHELPRRNRHLPPTSVATQAELTGPRGTSPLLRRFPDSSLPTLQALAAHPRSARARPSRSPSGFTPPTPHSSRETPQPCGGGGARHYELGSARKMTDTQASRLVAKFLLGESILEFRASTLWEMRFSNDLWLLAHEVSSPREQQLRELLVQYDPEMLSRVDPQDVPRAALLSSYMMHPVTATVVDENGQLFIQFGDARDLIVRVDAEFVDWQWCVSRTCSDPYSAASLIACFASGCIEAAE